MPGYDFQSPGSAATDAIQRYLLEQWKMQQAGAAADLNKRNVESEIADREANRRIQEERTKTEEEYRKSQEAELKARAIKEAQTQRDAGKGITSEFMKDYRANMVAPGTDVTGTSVENIPGVVSRAPNMIQARQGIAPETLGTTPTGAPGVVQPQAPTGGTTTQEPAGYTARTNATPDQIGGEVLAKLSLEKNGNETEQDVRKALAEHGGFPASFVEKTVKSWKDSKVKGDQAEGVYDIDPRKGTLVKIGEVPKGSHFATVPKPSSTTVNLGGIGNSGLTQEGLDMAAELLARTKTMPAMGMSSAKARTEIINRAAQFDLATGKFREGGAPPNLAVSGASYAADTAAMKQAQEMLTAVEAFAGTAKDNTALFNEVKGKVPDVGVSLINAPIRSLARAFGSESMAQFDVARQSLQTEYARLVAMPRLTGQLTDSARHDIEVGLSSTATVGQMEKAFKTLEREGENRRRNVKKQIEALKKDIGGGSSELDFSEFK